MSQENVETVRRAIAAVNERDIDAYLACCTENVELLMPVVGSQYLGAHGIGRFFSDIEDAGPDFRIEIDWVRATGDSRVLAFLRVGSTGRVSRIVTAAESATLYDFVDGKISRARIFFDRDEALKAAGLEPDRSSANLDVVQAIYADWERGDFTREDWADPAIELIRPESLDGDALRGREASSGGWREWLSAWKDFRAEAHDYRVLDDERVLVFGHMRGIGRMSGTSTDTETVNVFRIRDGKVVQLVLYSSRARAFADLGLEE